MSDDMRAFVQSTLEEAVQFDGVEANVALGDPESGETLSITFFRDQAARDAFHEFSRQKIAEAEAASEGNLEIVGSNVYTDVIAAQSP